MLGELEIDIGFTGTRNAVKQLSVSFEGLKFGEGLFLSGVKGDLFAIGGRRRGIWSSGGVGGSGSSGRFFAAIFFDAEREKKIGGFGDWI